MNVDWNYPVAHTFSDTAPKKGQKTAAVFVERALDRAIAFAKISADGNQRPLLVMRECVLCKGTDHALFTRRINNEKTKLLCRWFHCVKLPPKVLHAKHPFRKLFKNKRPPHLFISAPNGEQMVEFDGKQTQSQMQLAMVRLIQKSYENKPNIALKAMLRMLSEFDKYDGLITSYKNQLQRETLRKSPRKASLKKWNQKIAATEKKRAKAMEAAKAVCDLKLKITTEDKL